MGIETGEWPQTCQGFFCFVPRQTTNMMIRDRRVMQIRNIDRGVRGGKRFIEKY